MPADARLFPGLSEQDRNAVEQWLADFEQAWGPNRLRDQAAGLKAFSPALRLTLLVEMIRIDLERHWQTGRRRGLEPYLGAFPKLKGSRRVLADLVLAEWEVRRQFGAAADLRELAKQVALDEPELRRLEAECRRRSGGAGSGSERADSSGDPPRSHTGTRLFSAEQDTSQSRREPTGPVPAPSPQSLRLPERFGRYRILRQLGEGGMGSVYLAEDTQLERSVALKVPHFRPEDGPEVLERFLREARAAATFSHPNLCAVYDVGEIDGVHYLTMEYIEGRPLSSVIDAGKTIPPRQAAAVVRKLALALDEAHNQGVIHRDLKPSNVMIHTRRGPVAMDFGLARRAVQGDVRLTKNGAILGSPAYMPPEQVAGDLQAVGPLSDIYSLGVILYELLTGTVPFNGPLASVLGSIMTVEPEPPSARRSDIDRALEAICLKMMAKKTEDRYGSMQEVADALAAYLKGTQETVSPTPSAASAAAPPPAAPNEDAALAALFASQSGTNAPPSPVLPRRRTPSRPRPDWRSLSQAWRQMPTHLRWLTTAGTAAVLLALAITLFVRSGRQTIRIDIDDPTAQVAINGKEITITGVGDTVRLKPGKHTLLVKRGDIEAETRQFTVKKGDNAALQIRLLDDDGQVGRASESGVETGRLRDQATLEPAPTGQIVADPDRTARIESGSWKVEGEELVHTDAARGNCRIFFGDPAWTDYDYSFDVVKTAGAFGAAAMFRARDPDNWLLLDLAGWQNRYYTVESLVDKKFSWIHRDRRGAMFKDRLYRVLVKVRGTRYQCFVDDVLIYDFADNRHPQGAVGLRCWGGAVRVSNIRVRSPDGQVLWQGPPDLPATEPADDSSTAVPSANEQAAKVRDELRRRNPDFVGVIAYDIEEGRIVGCKIAGGEAPDLSPLAALADLRQLDYEALDPQRDAPVLREMESLETINGYSAATFRLAYPANKPAGGVDAAWQEGVGRLPAETQAEVVIKKLKELNPNLDSRITPTIEEGQVVSLSIDVADVITDLSPLEGMPLETLDLCANWNVSDLTSLKGMPLKSLWCNVTAVSDLSPLEGMPLKFLYIDLTRVYPTFRH